MINESARQTASFFSLTRILYMTVVSPYATLSCRSPVLSVPLIDSGNHGILGPLHPAPLHLFNEVSSPSVFAQGLTTVFRECMPSGLGVFVYVLLGGVDMGPFRVLVPPSCTLDC